jgi:macrolide transport system ATP-binding/permease protein
MQDIAMASASASQVMTTLLASVASIALLVGGIGIMNILLVSVTERTREIGIRMAVGAKARHILLQFLVESMTLSMVGGLLGIGVGVGSAQLLASLANWPSLLSPTAIAGSFLFSGVVGVIFGYYPAYKASRLDPIEALRYE